MSKYNQRGDGEAFIAVLFAISIGLFVWAVATMFTVNDLYNRWTRDCVEARGIVAKVSATGSECFIDGKITTLAGYEQYSTGIKN